VLSWGSSSTLSILCLLIGGVSEMLVPAAFARDSGFWVADLFSDLRTGFLPVARSCSWWVGYLISGGWLFLGFFPIGVKGNCRKYRFLRENGQNRAETRRKFHNPGKFASKEETSFQSRT
jgi:hypothetical protein